jgi:uncharacterized CHY-type Zn-finger protein
MLIHNIEVCGTDVDAETRCAHYHSEVDIIAIKFECCERWFPCFECHREHTAHAPEVWQISERDARAVLCGGCGYQLSITEYFECDSTCPKCRRRFNSRCSLHYNLYFEIY